MADEGGKNLLDTTNRVLFILFGLFILYFILEYFILTTL